MDPDQSQIQIDFVAVSLAAGETIRYQYRLEGANHVWSTPGQERTIHFAHLAPGGYRFLVQAVSGDGKTSPRPAAVAFTIRPPVWRRAWFLTVVGLTVLGAAYGLHRYRAAHLLVLERVRLRIATDLHDGLGSTLSQIALLSELVQRQVNVPQESIARMAKIADMARQAIEDMSDAVWLINPRKDNLRSLVTRIHHMATDLLEVHGIRWSLEISSDDDLEQVRLSAEERRHLFLIFKEALHNVVQHAHATMVLIDIAVAKCELFVKIQDNGRGFHVPGETSADPPGNGLINMRLRAQQLEAQLQIESTSGGTCITLRVPLTKSESHEIT